MFDELDSLSLPRRALSVLVLFVLSTSFLAALPAGAVSVTNGSDGSQSQSQPLLGGFRTAGAAPPDLQVLVNLAIPLRNSGLLTSMVAEVSDPSSPMFHHFLTASEMQSEFLPTAEYDQVMSRLQGSGLSVVETALDSIIVVQGTVAQVKQALGADVDLYTNGTSTYYMTSGASEFYGAEFVGSNATALLVTPRSLTSLGAQPGNVTFTEGAFSAKLLPPVYNATALYGKGIMGQGETIGLMDFFGNPTVTQDLLQFDRLYGFPDTNFTIIPVGPYNPNLGVSEGWDGEIDLDVQSSHSMAPLAAIDMYVPNNALSFAADLGPVVSQDRVTDLSMSFGVAPEWYWSFLGPSFFYFNVLLPDQLMALGSLRGITFLASSGDDGGGGGYSTSPAAQSSNPDDSPFVTSVGATQSYIFTNANGTESIKQTAWSNQGYVPEDGENAGGSGGGVSFLEPKPWYQSNEPTPPSYPNGRMEPDLALQGACDPATDIVIHGAVEGICGTSESSPLLSGLLTLVASYTGSPLGLINPFLYSIGNSAEYAKAFTPILNGFNIPWTAGNGYNMVSGWGSPNIGEIAALMKSAQPSSALDVSVNYVNSTSGAPNEFTAGQPLSLQVSVTAGGSPVSSGSFSANIASLSGASGSTPLSYNSTSGLWTATLTMGSESGISYLDVSGSSSGRSGSGSAEIFAGYLGSFLEPTGAEPWDTNMGVPVVVQSTDLSGNPAPSQAPTVLVKSYSITDNQFSQVDSVALSSTTLPQVGPVSEVNLTSTYPSGPLLLSLRGDSYGILPIMNGISLQNNYLFPEVAAEPGSAAPGQSLTVIAYPQAPVNVASIPSVEDSGTVGSDVAAGSNVTATLVNSHDVTIATTDLAYVPCNEALRVCGAGTPVTLFNGHLMVPANTPPGLYTVILTATYNSITTGYDLEGSYYGQVMVTSGPITPKVTFTPSVLYQGQSAKIIADIQYPSGQEVTWGEYTALVYPQNLGPIYTVLEHDEYSQSQLIPLAYDPAMNEWVGNLSVPSGANAGSLSSIDAGILAYSGPFEAYVTGISWDGVPTTSVLSAQAPFTVQPYVYSQGQTLSSSGQASGLALSGDTITGSGTVSDDLFTGTNTIQGGTVTISASQISGTLDVNDAKVTLVGVSGGNIVATGSTLTFLASNVGNLSLTGSTISFEDSSYQSITPSLLSLQPSGVPTQAFSGSASVTISANGQGANSLTVWVDGNEVGSSTGAPVTVSLAASALPDGVHSLQATATQTDGLSSSATWYFSTDAQLAASNSTLSTTKNNLSTTTEILYATLGLAVVALLVAIVAVARRPRAASPTS